MQLIHDQTLKQTSDDTLVQRAHHIRWADDRSVRGTVQVLDQRPIGPSLDELVAWVDRSGGRWATDEQVAQI